MEGGKRAGEKPAIMQYWSAGMIVLVSKPCDALGALPGELKETFQGRDE